VSSLTEPSYAERAEAAHDVGDLYGHIGGSRLQVIADRAALRAIVRAAAGTVTYRQRKVADLRSEGYTIPEIAETLGAPTRDVWQVYEDYLRTIGAVEHFIQPGRPACPWRCEIRHRRAPGPKPVSRRGSRRTCAPTRGSPSGDPDLPDEHIAVHSPLPIRKEAVR